MGCCTVDFYGTQILTTVTSSANVVDEWISTIYEIHCRRTTNLILGLDIEWRPYFPPQKRNPVAILQICIGRRCLIFQLLHADSIPESLRRFLAFPDFTFVGVGVKEDADKLFEELHLRVASTMDIAQVAAEKYGFEDFRRRGLKRLAMELIGKHMEKPKHVTLSRWDEKKLSYEQIEYATIDAYVSFELGLSLLKGFRSFSTVPFPVHHHSCDMSLLKGFRRVSTVPFPVHHHSCNIIYGRPPVTPCFVVYSPPAQFV